MGEARSSRSSPDPILTACGASSPGCGRGACAAVSGLALVAVVAAVSLGFVLLAGLGARRADTGWDRLRADARADDILLDTTSFESARDLARGMREEPGVTGTAAAGYAYLVPDGRLEDFFGGAIVPLDRAVLDRISRPVVTEGRRADPARVDEAVANPDFVTETGRGVGDQVVLVDPFGLIRQRVTIVGIGVQPIDFTSGLGSPLAYLTPAFVDEWAGELRDGEQQGGTDSFSGVVLVRSAPGRICCDSPASSSARPGPARSAA